MKDFANFPPRLVHRFFRWFCHQELRDSIEGDLLELYNERLKISGKKKADIKFILDVLLLFRPGIIRPPKNYKINQYGMYKSYFKIGWRNLSRSKGYSFINVGGLAVGMAVAILIGLWMNDELSYDKYHSHYDRVAQVMQLQTFNGERGASQAIPLPLEPELRKSYGNDFKYLVMTSWNGHHILSFGDDKITREGNFMDVDGPRLLDLKMIRGSLDGLKEQGSILLSKSASKSLFGEKESLGELIRIDNKLDVKVTGVYEDLPFNTEFHDLYFIAPFKLYMTSEKWLVDAVKEQIWGNNSFQLYAQIEDHLSMDQVNAKIKNVKLDRVSEEEKIYQAEIFLHPMSQWHLQSKWKDGVQTGGLIQYVWMFGVIGIFVVLLACINFMNLSTARSEQRGKEVGIRKSIGSLRNQLVGQFLCESFLVVVMAYVLALIIVLLAIPSFNNLTDKEMSFPYDHTVFWLGGLGFVIFTGFLAGSYPALYLSSFSPVKVLKGTFRTGRFTSLPRKILVVVQFAVSVTLIIGTVIVYQQIQYTKNRPIGYNRNNIMMIQMVSPDFYGKYDLLRNELKNAGVIEEMSESSSPLTAVWSNNGGFNWDGKDPGLQAEFATIWVTTEFGKTIDWQVKEGRDFSREFKSDSAAIVINESAVRFMGIENPIGTKVRWGDESRGRNYTIIGVVKDVLMESPFRAVKQTVYLNDAENANWIELKLNSSKSLSESVAGVEKVFKKIIPSAPFDFQFADQEHNKKFASEDRVGVLSGLFAGLAIFISCLGLFGLASFVAEQRTKEIGIRKVLGASVAGLWRMLSADFILLAVISSLIAIPGSYYLLDNWLQGYDYHQEISWWIFLIAIAFAVALTLVTVSYQALRAAYSNPVKSLKSE